MTTVAKHGLGKGLGALIPPRPAEPPPTEGVRQVSVAQIEPNPHQPRKRFAPQALDELAASIREHGLIQPLLVQETQTPYGPRYQLIAGERRWRAAQRAGLTSVAVIVKGVTSQQMLELALVENVQRADLNILEQAEAYQQLMQEFEMTQEQIAAKMGKDRTTISNALRLLKMPPALKEAVLNDDISEGHARALMQVTDPAKQHALLVQVRETHLSVRQTEELVRRALDGGRRTDDDGRTTNDDGRTKDGRQRTKDKGRMAHDTHSLEEALRRALGTKVELYRSQRGGKIIIEFYSDEELETIYERIVN